MTALTVEYRKHSEPEPAYDITPQTITNWKFDTRLELVGSVPLNSLSRLQDLDFQMKCLIYRIFHTKELISL